MHVVKLLVFMPLREQCIVFVAESMPAIVKKAFDRQPLMSHTYKQVHGVEPDMAQVLLCTGPP